MSQGKGILQPHTLLDEIDNVFAEDETRESLINGPFGGVIKAAEVDFPSLPLYFIWNNYFFLHSNYGYDQKHFRPELLNSVDYASTSRHSSLFCIISVLINALFGRCKS